MPTSAAIVVEFINGRPDLDKRVRKIARDPFKAPEGRVNLVQEHVLESFDMVTEAERAGLDRIRGNGNIDWEELVEALRGPGLAAREVAAG